MAVVVELFCKDAAACGYVLRLLRGNMNCPIHPKREVIGYCAECGTVGCDVCIKEVAKRKLCSRCYRKAEREWEQQRHRKEVRQRHPKQRLIVRYADGRLLKGMSYTIDPNSRGFYLAPRDGDGEPVFVKFTDLKAVFFVRDFEGKYDEKKSEQEWVPEGHEVTVKFTDGKVIEGYALKAYDEDAPRFHLIPKETCNNISVLVERANVAQVAAGGTFEPGVEEVQREQEPQRSKPEVRQEETIGDFYFQTKNYTAALAEYEKALKGNLDNERLRKKLVISKYNVGVQYVKIKDYRRALHCFEEVLKLDHDNESARKKVKKLRHIVLQQDREKVKA